MIKVKSPSIRGFLLYNHMSIINSHSPKEQKSQRDNLNLSEKRSTYKILRLDNMYIRVLKATFPYAKAFSS